MTVKQGENRRCCLFIGLGTIDLRHLVKSCFAGEESRYAEVAACDTGLARTP